MNSTDSLEKIYQNIGTEVVALLPNPWEEAVVYTFIDSSDSGMVWGRYKEVGAKSYQSFDLNFEIYTLFEEMREILIDPKHKTPWIKAKFTVQPNKKFACDIKYFSDDKSILELELKKCHDNPDLF